MNAAVRRPPEAIESALADHLYVLPGRILYIGRLHNSTPHAHYAAAFYVSLDGPFRIVTEHDTFTTDAVLVPSYLPFSIESHGTRAVVASVDPDLPEFGGLLEIVGDGTRAVPLDRMRLPGFDAGSAVRALTCEEARSLHRKVTDSFASHPRTDPLRIDPRIRRAIRLLKTRPPVDVSVSDLAAGVGLSDGRFMHLFSESMGTTCRRYISWMRVQWLMRFFSRGMNLTEAAVAAGFSDGAHGSRVFREMVGYRLSWFITSRYAITCHYCL